MPPAIQKGLSVTILTTIATSIIVAILGWFGNTAIDTRDTTISNEFNLEKQKEYRDLLMKKIDALLIITTDNKIAISENHVKVDRNQRDLVKCEKRLNAFLLRDRSVQ